MPVCNICGGTDFQWIAKRGAAEGLPPECARCGSRERHRIVRSVCLRFPRRFLSARDCLQFSRDVSVERQWFRTHKVSIYRGENHIDLMRIPLASASMGFILCNHVLEHVPDDRVAFGELVRILSPDGVLLFTVPILMDRVATDDYPERHPKYGHYRVYGTDLMQRLAAGSIRYCRLLELREVDSVTGVEDRVYLAARGAAVSEQIEGSVSPLILRRFPPAAPAAGEAAIGDPAGADSAQGSRWAGPDELAPRRRGPDRAALG